MNLEVSKRYVQIWRARRGLIWCNNICMKFSNASKHIITDWKKWATNHKYRGATNSHYQVKKASFKGNAAWPKFMNFWKANHKAEKPGVYRRLVWRKKVLIGTTKIIFMNIFYMKLYVAIVMALCNYPNLKNYRIDM